MRIWSLWNIYKSSNESTIHRKAAVRGVMRLLIGGSFDKVDWSTKSARADELELESLVKNIMEGTVEKRFTKWYNDSLMSFHSTPRWELQVAPKSFKFSELQGSCFNEARKKLAAFCGQHSTDFEVCHNALLRRGFGSCAASRHERLEIGDVVELLLNENRSKSEAFLHISYSQSGRSFYFVIGGLLQSKDGTPWALVKPCTIINTPMNHQIQDFNRLPLLSVRAQPFYSRHNLCPYQFLKLDHRARSVGVIHDCGADGSCRINMNSRTISHTCTTISGGHFFLLPRSMGFPPRRS